MTTQMDINRPSKRRKLADRCLPVSLSSTVPESRLYQDLMDMERKLDWTIARKRVELQDAVNKPTKTKRILRVFLSNSASGQEWQDTESELLPGQAADFSTGRGIPAWTLRIEGRLLDTGQRHLRGTGRKFSSFLNALIVELDRDSSLFPDGNTIEWHRTNSEIEQDGFEIKRFGDAPVKCRILLDIAHNPPRHKVLHELASVIGVQEDNLTGIMNGFWNYVRQHGLQDKADRRIIKADAKLRPLFRGERLFFHEVPGFIHSYMSQTDHVILPYTVRTDSSGTYEPKAFDIEVDVDDFAAKSRMKEVLVGLSSDTSSQVSGLDEEISLSVMSVRNAKLKRDFLESFALNPTGFIERWLASQARDLETMLGHESGMRGDLRRSDNFQLPWVEEAVVVHEGIRVAESLAKAMNPNRVATTQ